MNEKITVTINGDVKDLTNAMEKASNELSLFQKVVSRTSVKTAAAIGGIALGIQSLSVVKDAINNYIITPFANAVNSFVEFGDSISKTAQRIGVGVDALSGLKFAAEQCGGNFDALVDGLKTFQNQLGAAKLGDEGAINKLGKAGVNAGALIGLDTEQQLYSIADYIASIGDKSEQTRVAMELFGEAGYKLLPLLQEGSAGIKKLVAEGEDIGAVLGEKGVNSAVNLADSMNRLKTASNNVTNQGVALFAPIATVVLDVVAKVTATLGGLVKIHGVAESVRSNKNRNINKISRVF